MGRELKEERSGAARPAVFRPAVLNATIFLVGAAVLLAVILLRTHGQFSYCLDDPYIHLALAERLRNGLYGLNVGEAASPSSSILWPLLFVPFAGSAAMAWLPLVVNVCCGALTAWALGGFVEEAFPGRVGRWRGVLLGVLLVAGLNLWGLAYTGLEHSLQVLLCVLCALTAVRVMHGETAPWWGLAAAVVLPSVRYEGLLITVGLAMVLAGVRAWGQAVAVVAASVVVPAAFSVFLHRLGLPWFPLSVLVKSSYKFQDQSALPVRVARLVVQTVKQSLFDLERLPQLVITVLLVVLLWKHRRTRSLRFALGAAAMVGAVQVVLGPVGWFYRYEIYALAFTLPVLMAAAALPGTESMTESDLGTRSQRMLDVTSPSLRVGETQRSATVPIAVLVGAAVLALIYVRPLVGVPVAAVGIVEQQYQLGRLTSEFYHAPVAVNDLGWVAFRRTPQQYTLDLFGLGSYEAFQTKEKDRTPQWLDAVTREHHVGLVAIYPEWFTRGVPTGWTPLAKLCAEDVDTQLGPVSQRVMLYATGVDDFTTVRDAVAEWAGTLTHSRTTIVAYPTDNRTACR